MNLITRIQSLAIAIANLGKAAQQSQTNPPTQVPKPQVEAPPPAPTISVCPEFKPQNGDPCSNYDLGLNCDYEYVNTSCNEGEGKCSPIENYSCRSDGWALAMPMFSCPGDLPSSFLEPCAPSDETKPEVESPPPAPTSNVCPALKPQNGDPCFNYDLDLNCDYEYINTSCNEGEVKCSPSEFYRCRSDGWALAMPMFSCPEDYPSSFAEPCSPSAETEPEVESPPPAPPSNICPELKPESGDPCFNYDLGLNCDYEYVNTSCEDGKEQCSPTQFYTCRHDGWSVAMARLGCPGGDLPPDFGRPCKPCPESMPDMNASCTDAGFGAGQKCYYEYRNTSCERGQVNCSPLQTWECTEWGDWMVMMPFMACPRNTPPGFLEECKP